MTVVEVGTPDGARLAVALVGDHEGDRPLAILQHGFPDSPSTWRHLAPRLVAQGYRVATPWLRGYLPSTVGSTAPTLDAYAVDLATVHSALGGDDRAVLVGHDWGAAALWRAAGIAPWRALVALAVPPDPVLAAARGDVGQWWRSRYMVRVQVPVSGMLRRRQLEPLVALWHRWSPGYEPTEEDLAGLRAALATRTAVRAAVQPYRAGALPLLRGALLDRDAALPTQPTLYLHGTDDACFPASYAERTRALLGPATGRSRVELVPDAGHFLQLEQPELVGRLVTSFLAGV